ncbi:glycosyltransferase [Actinocrispum sp. NPDC049592]|uniref:glycosyltransferase n=1 Tax=Actinocrispum sp. NPDC049592 TaxID=3154835 RepID=UPI0034441FE0
MRQLRLAADLSTRALGELIHYSNAHVSRVEQGLSPPSMTFAAGCDRVFGTGDELARAAARLTVVDRRAGSRPWFDVPAGPSRLIGREADVDALRKYLHGGVGRTARVCVVYGMAGVGKTAIALSVAELVHENYPDGCMYLDMQGYTPDVNSLTDEDALDSTLRRMGVAGEVVPQSVDDREALFRQKLTDRRLLIIVDNVANVRQVSRLRPPNGRTSLIVISRHALTGLDAEMHWNVGALAPGEAVELFRWVSQLPPDSYERGNPIIVDKIVQICCGLPLAICIVASRFRDNPVRRLEDVAARLADHSAWPNELDDGIRSVMAVFATSCATLSDTQRAMLALLVLHPGPRVDAYAAAALAGTNPALAESVLDELIRTGMLERHSHNAYRLHDLLRGYLRQPEAVYLSPAETMASRGRLFDYYTHTAAAADRRIDEHRYRVQIDSMSSAVTIRDFPDKSSAVDWMNREVGNFLQIAHEMETHAEALVCWQFVYYLRGYLFATKQWELMIACFVYALAAARRSENHRAIAIALNNLGLAHAQLHRNHEAMSFYAEARVEFYTADDLHGEMNVVANHAWLAYDSGQYELACELATTARNFYRAHGQYSNAAIALDCVARCELRLGSFSAAEGNFDQALREFDGLRFSDGDVAQLLSHLGETEHHLGKLEKAGAHYNEAILRARKGKSLREEAAAFEGLSRVALAQGRAVDADAHRAAAIALYEEVGGWEDVERVRADGHARSMQDDGSIGVTTVETRAPTGNSKESLSILVVNTEWSSRNGGQSTFNRELCKALASLDVTVFCSVPDASADESRDAQAAGVHLVKPPPSLGDPYAALSRPPKLPLAVVPQVVIGHGRKTGEAAMWLVEDHFRNAKLLHVLHVIPDRVEFEKDYSPGEDSMATAEQRINDEILVAKRADLAIGIGPVLYHYLRDRLLGTDAPEPLRLDPGFDLLGSVIEPPPPSDTIRVLLAGRLSMREVRVKGVDIAARALGAILTRRRSSESEIELVLRGVADGEGRIMADAVRSWAGTGALRVVPRPYSADAATLNQDMHQATLVIMPSRTEGFGLIGLEAMARGVPTLVSKSSGLGALLYEQRSSLSVELANRVIPVTDEERADTLRWSDAIANVIDSPKPAFIAAKMLGEDMAARQTWRMAASTLLNSIAALLNNS